jgi:hypothetical protein
MPRRIAPLQIQQQFGFIGRLLPLIALLVPVALFHVWKDVEADRLRHRLFTARSLVFSLQGELQQLKTEHSSLISLARLESNALELGLIWPEQPGRRLVCDNNMYRGEPELPITMPSTKESMCEK